MKVRDYLMLVKWLDKRGDDRLSEFCIVVDFGAFEPSAMMLGGKWGKSASDVSLCDSAYDYVLDMYVVRDMWDSSITTLEPFSSVRLWVSPDKRKAVSDEMLRIPNELLHDLQKGW